MPIDLAQAGPVATITMNIPERRNALSFEMRAQLHELLKQVNEDSSVRAVVLTGAGVAFCAGADVEAMATGGLAESRARMLHSHALIRTLYRLEKPVIAAVRGHAVGFGWSLALACDRKYGSKHGVYVTEPGSDGGDGGPSSTTPAVMGHPAKAPAVVRRFLQKASQDELDACAGALVNLCDPKDILRGSNDGGGVGDSAFPVAEAMAPLLGRLRALAARRADASEESDEAALAESAEALVANVEEILARRDHAGVDSEVTTQPSSSSVTGNASPPTPREVKSSRDGRARRRGRKQCVVS